MRAFAPRSLAVRRLGGSSAAFDRRFFIFLEAVRRKSPEGTAGVVLWMLEPTTAARHLAAYQLAPLLVALAPEPAPGGWLLARYGGGRPQGWRVIA